MAKKLQKTTKMAFRVDVAIDLDFTAADRRWFAKGIAAAVKEMCDDARYDDKRPRSKVAVAVCKT